MSFTDQRPRVATETHVTKWGGDGKCFRCYLCGHKFKVGDVWRWVANPPWGIYGNFLVCEKCDGADVLDRWISANKELEERFLWGILET